MAGHSETMDLASAAARLKVPWHTAYRWVLTGKLEGERREGRWFVSAASVLRIAEERNVAGA